MKEFVQLILKSTVLFYQLDVKATETTEVCLYNLLTSLVLKNPIYSKVVELFKIAQRDDIQQIEIQIEKIKAQRWNLARVFDINEVAIGRKILYRKNRNCITEEAE